MSTKPNNPPAFPEPERFRDDGTPFTVAQGFRQPGMTLLDWFAGQALAGYCANPETDKDIDAVAKWAYRQADAMLAAREEKS